MRVVFLFVALSTTAVFAKSWNGIEPGVSRREDVIKKFGEPTKKVTNDGREVLAYLQKQAIKGTKQAQFKVDPATKIVERIDVFPGPVVDKEAVEGSFGPPCPKSGPVPATACYTKKVTDDFRTYFLYARLGVAIFFNEDGKTVQSFIFQAPKTQ